MDLDQLREYIGQFVTELKDQDRKFLETKLKGLISVFPFSEYEYILIFLRDRNILTFLEYEKLRDAYVKSNKYLSLYEVSPRVLGRFGANNI